MLQEGSLSDRIPRSRPRAWGAGGQTLSLGISTTVLEHEDGRAPFVAAIFPGTSRIRTASSSLNRRNERRRRWRSSAPPWATRSKATPGLHPGLGGGSITRPGLDDEDRNILRGCVGWSRPGEPASSKDSSSSPGSGWERLTEWTWRQVARDALAHQPPAPGHPGPPCEGAGHNPGRLGSGSRVTRTFLPPRPIFNSS